MINDFVLQLEEMYEGPVDENTILWTNKVSILNLVEQTFPLKFIPLALEHTRHLLLDLYIFMILYRTFRVLVDIVVLLDRLFRFICG